MFFCEFCNARPEGFSRRDHLDRHVEKQHRFGERWRCSRIVEVDEEERECGKEYSSVEMLKEHIGSTHEGIRYKCRHSWCTKSYKRPSNLCTHERKCWPPNSDQAMIKVKRPRKKTMQRQEVVEGRAAHKALWAVGEAEPTRVAPKALVEGALLSSSTRPRRRRGQGATITVPSASEPSSSEVQHGNYPFARQDNGTSVPMNIPFNEGELTLTQNPWAHQQPNTGFNFFTTPPSTLPLPLQPHYDQRLHPGQSSSQPHSLPPVQGYEPINEDTTDQAPLEMYDSTSFILDNPTIPIAPDNTNVDVFAQQELPMNRNRQRTSSRNIRHRPYTRPSRRVRQHMTFEQAFGSLPPGMHQTAPDIDGPLIGYGEDTTGLQYSQHASHSRGSSSSSVYTQPLQPFDPTPEYWPNSTTPSTDPTSEMSYRTQPSFPCPMAESEARDFEQARANSLLLQQGSHSLQEPELPLFVEGSSGGAVGQVDNNGGFEYGMMGAMDTSAWDLQFLNCPALDENTFPFIPYQHCEGYERQGGDDGQDHRNL